MKTTWAGPKQGHGQSDKRRRLWVGVVLGCLVGTLLTFAIEVAEPPFPVESLAENVTVVLPRGNTVGALVVTATSPLTRSNAVPEVR